MYKLTAAHRTLPFETMVRVTNLNNGKSTVVRITDRGPFVDNRVIDLSFAAAREVDSIGPGVVPVRVEVISPGIDATSGFFTVQVGAFRDRGNADRLRDRLGISYSPIFIQQYDSPDGVLYRLKGFFFACASAKFRERMPRVNLEMSCAIAKASHRLWCASMMRLRQEDSVSADCLFCKIGDKKIPSKIVYQDDEVFAFEDISPQAPTHILICPRKHFESLTEAAPEDQAVLGKLQLVAAQLARERKVLAGYRTVLNNGTGDGQSVFHLHLHLLGGRNFRWPPG